MKPSLLLVLLGLLPCVADPFVNLTFDAPDLSGPLIPVYRGGPLEGDTSKILPGWTLLVNGESQSRMIYSPPGSGGADVATLVHNGLPDSAGPSGPYSLSLESPLPVAADIRVHQTGTIPADAVGLWAFGAGPFRAFINGENVYDALLGAGDPVSDVSRFAGQTVDLEFRALPANSVRLDVLGFTTVPEPSTWALLCLGLAFRGGRPGAKNREDLPTVTGSSSREAYRV